MTSVGDQGGSVGEERIIFKGNVLPGSLFSIPGSSSARTERIVLKKAESW